MIALNVLVPLLIIGIIIAGSTQHIVMPIMLDHYTSIYFILIIVTIECTINYGILTLLSNKFRFTNPKEKKIILLAAASNTVMSFCLIYSASTTRCPVVIQSIFLGLAVIPSVILTKFYLKKQVTYNPYYTIPSVILLLLSIIIAIYPLFSSNVSVSIWIFIYLVGIFAMSTTNICQEKYIMITQDNSFLNKVQLAFYISLTQIMILPAFCWIELIFGYTSRPVDVFFESAYLFVTDIHHLFVLQLFIYICLIVFLLAVYLNAISTNYNMILTNLTNQSVAIFFAIFPSLNHVIQHPLYITLVSLTLNVLSVILWINGETKDKIENKINKHNDKNYGSIEP